MIDAFDKNNLKIIVFKINNEVFEPIGEINNFYSLICGERFCGYTSFQFSAPVNDETAELLKEGNVLWYGRESACFIESIETSIDDNAHLVITAKGRTLEVFLTWRIFWGKRNFSKYTPTQLMEKAIESTLVETINTDPADEIVKRSLPFFELQKITPQGEKIDSKQVTCDNVYDFVTEVGETYNLGFSVNFYPREKRMVFKVDVPEDRTQTSTTNSPVLISTDLNDILTSYYSSSIQDEKNVAWIYGEERETETATYRVKAMTGDINLTGFERKELYVDARDLQSTTDNPDVPLTDEEYNSLLIDRGNLKLTEYRPTKAFEATVRVDENAQYQYGIDYKKGDKITVYDANLKVLADVTVSGFDETFTSDGHTFSLILGFEPPSLYQKVKRQFA